MLIKSETMYFSERSIIFDWKEKASGLMVVHSGQVRLELPLDSAEADAERKHNRSTTLVVLNPGDSFGDTSVLGDSSWAGKYGVSVDFVAHTHCAVTFVSAKDIEDISAKFEFFPIRCRIQRARQRKARFETELCSSENFWGLAKQGIPAAEDTVGLKKYRTLKTKSVFFWSLIARRVWDLRVRQRDNLDEYLSSQLTSQRALSIREPTTTEDEEQEVLEAFRLFDTDGNGHMDRREVAALLALGYRTPDQGTEWGRRFHDLLARDDGLGEFQGRRGPWRIPCARDGHGGPAQRHGHDARRFRGVGRDRGARGGRGGHHSGQAG
mmetsp:Transcript_30427/g.80910  ORF Transcript_30427/g.80910 Transcript_30427/m.80910 type:complete len:324 (-) Transcript_30427:669-1640(-)